MTGDWGESVFVALELPERREGKAVRLAKKLLRRPRAQLEEAQAAGADFWLIRAPIDPGEEPPWAEIEELTGHLAGRMLLPDDVSAPPDGKIRPLACPGFDQQVLLDTACQLIHRTRMPMYRRLLGLIDPQARHTGLLAELLKYFTAVQVVTEDQAAYTAAAEQMMEEMGAPVMVSGSYSSLGDCVLVLLPDGEGMDWSAPLPCPVLAGASVPPDKSPQLITGLQAQAAKTLITQCPMGISAHRLAGALFEDQGLQFDSYVADKMFYRYKSCGMGDIVREIGQEAGTLSLF